MNPRWAYAVLAATMLLSASLAVPEEDDRQAGKGDGGSAQPSVSVVTRTVYVLDPATEKNLTDARLEEARLKMELSLQNTTIEYARIERQGLVDEIARLNASNARLASDIDVLKAYGRRQPDIDESLFIGAAVSQDVPPPAPVTQGPPQPANPSYADMPSLLIKILSWLNLI